MNQFKRKISLCLAFIMVLGLFAPFTLPAPLIVLANTPPIPPDTAAEGTAFSGNLRVSFNQRLTPANLRPDFTGGRFIAPEGGVMVNWPVSVTGSGAMVFDVLRFFDSDGHRHELSLLQIPALLGDIPQTGLMVNYDIFVPRRNAAGTVVGYRHINDPLRRVSGFYDGSNLTAGFMIWTPGLNDFVLADRFFNELNGNQGVRDTEEFTRLNRVNDRLRFQEMVPGTPYTHVRADYLMPTNLNSRTTTVIDTIPNPDYDPTDPNSPPFIDVIVDYPIFPSAHYTHLSPSFNISEGRGYSFRFGGRALHFRWHSGQFYFFIEDFLEQGFIYEFVLERYASRSLANEYVVGAPLTAALDYGTPAPNRMVNAEDRPAHTRNMVYVFTGINTDEEQLNAIPFAHNVHVPDYPNTRLSRLTGNDDPAHLLNSPLVDHSPLDMTDPNDPALPAQQDLGLDIRFNLPSLHDEDEGMFSYDILAHPLAGSLNIDMIMSIDGTRTPEDFHLRLPLVGMEDRLHIPLIGDDPWDAASLRLIDPNGNSNITLRDVSMLHRVGTGHADRARIKIGGMTPSLAYQNVSLTLTTAPLPVAGQVTHAPGNFLYRPGTIVADFDNPFYTFLNMTFGERNRQQVVVIEPFNLSVGRFDYPAVYGLEIHGISGSISQPTIPNQQEIIITLPEGIAQSFVFTIYRRRGMGSPRRLNSQDVLWVPSTDPGINLPHNFRIRDVLHRPMRGDSDAGHLTFTALWDIAQYSRDIMPLFGAPDGEFGHPDDVLRIQYIVGLSTAPETTPLVPGAPNDHRGYLRVDMLIRLGASGLEVMYLESSDFIYPPRHPNTPHPIVNREEWLPLARRMDPIIGQYVVEAQIEIETNTVRRYRGAVAELRADFNFPGVYFMNVGLVTWGVYEALNGGEYRNRRDVGLGILWSLFDYITIDDFGTLSPPPPSNLEVTTGPVYPDVSQPFLNVSFGIPSGAILSYLQTLYPMRTQITTNLYIGQFHEAILDSFFPQPSLIPGGTQQGRQSLAPGLRRAHSAVSVRFDDLLLNAEFDWEYGVTRLDLSSFRYILSGEAMGQHASGVVRITDIPIIHHVPITTTPAGITFAPGDAVNFGFYPYLNMHDSFNETDRILGLQTDHLMHLRLDGMEENTAFFLFADLEVAKWLEVFDEDGNFLYYEERENNPPDAPNPAVSDLTGIVSGTTIGTPPYPGPGEVGPSAPRNIGVRDIDQMQATVYWDPYILTDAEIANNVRIEWEIIRIQDGERLTNEQMNSRVRDFAGFFGGLNTYPAHRKGWITDAAAITVLPANRLHPAPDYYYAYDRFVVELTDKTLLPNNVYFYYVRTVRIEEAWDHQLNAYVLVRSVSVWVEVPVTTFPIEAPFGLRQEDPGNRAGFDPQTMVAVSWEHVLMEQILLGRGQTFLFHYQIRESDTPWGEYHIVPPEWMIYGNLDYFNRNRLHYIAGGLEHSTVYEMRVRLYCIVSGDRSVWSNVIVFMTDIDQEEAHREREVNDWLNYLRRRLEERLRRPFWIAQQSGDTLVIVLRPDDVFNGFILENTGTALPLYNTGVDHVVYYIPISSLLTANENRRGFSVTYPDMQILFAPSFLNDARNQPMIDMARDVERRGSQLTDAFVRITIDRNELDEINGVPAITHSTIVYTDMVATNDRIRNIRSWDLAMHRRATQIVESWLTDYIMRENIMQHLLEEFSNEDISDYVYHVLERIWDEVIRATGRYFAGGTYGILSGTVHTITEFNAPMHLIVTPPSETHSIFGHEFVNDNWRSRDTVEYRNGRAILARAPGRFAFSGREIIIPYIEVTPRGGVVVSIVARFGLEDLFGVYVDLEQNATRQMVVGSVARMAGVPQNANAFNWANANLNVQMSSRNATGLISRQEAIAITMALYEQRTGTRVNTIRIHNHTNTAGMVLDRRYEQAVRAAFEMGIISDTDMNPAGHITIGEFLDMLTLLAARVRI